MTLAHTHLFDVESVHSSLEEMVASFTQMGLRPDDGEVAETALQEWSEDSDSEDEAAAWQVRKSHQGERLQEQLNVHSQRWVARLTQFKPRV